MNKTINENIKVDEITVTSESKLGNGGTITAGTLKGITITKPLTQAVNWNPEEYKVININTEKGFIELEKIK